MEWLVTPFLNVCSVSIRQTLRCGPVYWKTICCWMWCVHCLGKESARGYSHLCSLWGHKKFASWDQAGYSECKSPWGSHCLKRKETVLTTYSFRRGEHYGKEVLYCVFCCCSSDSKSALQTDSEISGAESFQRKDFTLSNCSTAVASRPLTTL